MSDPKRVGYEPPKEKFEATFSDGSYHLTKDTWEKISGKKVPEGIETVILERNGDAVGWKDNKEKVVLNESDSELDEHGWAKADSEAARLWKAAYNSDQRNFQVFSTEPDSQKPKE